MKQKRSSGKIFLALNGLARNIRQCFSDVSYCRRGIGTQVLDMLKQYFRYEIKSACRFLVVDAYNNDDTLRFYENNGFLFVFPEEEDEKKFLKKNALETRLMVFDLISV